MFSASDDDQKENWKKDVAASFLTWRAVAAPPLVRIRVNPSSAARRADAWVVIVKMIKIEMITILITVVVMISDHDDHDHLVSILS